MDLAPYWKTVVDTLQDGLLVVDRRGLILAINPAAERLTGYRCDELVGRSCRVLNCSGCRILDPVPNALFCGLFAEGDVRDKRCRITHKQGRIVHIRKSAAVLCSPAGEVLGAVETLTDLSQLVRQEREIALLRRSAQGEEGFYGLQGASPAMRRLIALVESVAASEAPVLIQGESGTGKELVARAIHMASPRHSQPFIKVNCSALNENLLETELFGHVRGAYTGAERNRVGRFEAAHGGTIFLDEIGDISPATQVKLLRVLEEREIERVGDHRPVAVDVRVLTATHRDLEALIRRGDFREDLFFRISVFPLRCPTLAERREDIPAIVAGFLGRLRLRSGRGINGLKPGAMERLLAHSWPGNVRELRNAIDYAAVLCNDEWIDERHLPPKLQRHTCDAPHEGNGARHCREELVDALQRSGGRRNEAARLLGVSRVTLWKRMKRYGVDLEAQVKT